MATLWSILGTPTATPLLQLAADGRWESCVAFSVGSDTMAAAQQLSSGAKFLAMEVMWPGQAFVGTGWPAEHWSEAGSAAERVLAAAASTAEEAFTALLGEKPSDTIESAELGAVNAWLSVGPEPLWLQADPTVTPHLPSRPELTLCTHPVAVEFGLSGSKPQWAAVVVSDPEGSMHRLNPAKFAAAMSILR